MSAAGIRAATPTHRDPITSAMNAGIRSQVMSTTTNATPANVMRRSVEGAAGLMRAESLPSFATRNEAGSPETAVPPAVDLDRRPRIVADVALCAAVPSRGCDELQIEQQIAGRLEPRVAVFFKAVPNHAVEFRHRGRCRAQARRIVSQNCAQCPDGRIAMKRRRTRDHLVQ